MFSFITVLLEAYYHGSRSSRQVALSFDDGPDWGEEQLLLALNQAGMSATFFWIAEKTEKMYDQNLERFNRILQLLKETGHEVGVHALNGFVSSNPIKRIRGVISAEEIVQAQQILTSIVGYKPRLYRPHCIQFSGREITRSIEITSMRLVLGSPWYTIGQNKKKLADAYIKAVKRAKPGTIICGHSSKNGNTDLGIASESAAIVPQLKEILHEKGLGTTTISEILESGD